MPLIFGHRKQDEESNIFLVNVVNSGDFMPNLFGMYFTIYFVRKFATFRYQVQSRTLALHAASFVCQQNHLSIPRKVFGVCLELLVQNTVVRSGEDCCANWRDSAGMARFIPQCDYFFPIFYFHTIIT